MSAATAPFRWDATRPRVLVVACSDGRLQEPTDEFLATLGIRRYDRLYVPGGAGALAPSGKEFIRARHMRRECQFLAVAHQLEEIILVFHGPAADGPAEAMCADYTRKLPQLSVAKLLEQQQRDAEELLGVRQEWAATANIRAFRCETRGDGRIVFVPLLKHEPRLTASA